MYRVSLAEVCIEELTMADDMAQEVEQRDDVYNPTGTVECLVDVFKRIVGLGNADDDNLISTALVRKITPNVFH